MRNQIRSDYQIIISHSGIDAWVAKQIRKWIETCNATAFLDESDIQVGDEFEKVLIKQIKQSKEFLVLFTPWSLERPYIWWEIGAASSNNLRIIGILHGLTVDDLVPSKFPKVIPNRDLINLNNIDEYFHQLKKRVN